jgi:4-hydroxybenzoate polyprenyltransferase
VQSAAPQGCTRVENCGRCGKPGATPTLWRMTVVITPGTPVAHPNTPIVVWHQLKCVFHEARPVVQLVFLMRLLAATGLVWHPTSRGFVTVMGWLPLVVAIYVFNGVTDVSSDIANGSARPIASGQISCAVAKRWCLVSAGLGLTLCWLAAPAVFALGAVLLAVGWAYSDGPSLKNTPIGFGVIVGVGAALTYVAGWLASGQSIGTLPVMLVIAGWVGLCCASKDFSDIDGDRLAGRHTWPVVFGPRGAARLLGVVAVTGGAAALAGSLATRVAVAPAAVLLGGSLLLAVVVIGSAARPERTTRRRPYRAFMATQYAANVTMICTGFV